MHIFRIFKSISRNILENFGFEIARLRKSPRRTLCGLHDFPFSTIIDVGANTGQFASYIREIFPEAMIVCFEPLPEAYRELSCWAKKQEGNAVTFNVAIGEKAGNMNMFYHKKHSPSSSLLSSTAIVESYFPFTKEQVAISVEINTLDGVLRDMWPEIKPEVLVKVDVQGYEDRVLRGGSETLKKAAACILEVSIDYLYEGQANFLDLLQVMNDMGFTFAGILNQVCGEDGHVIYFDAVFIDPIKISWGKSWIHKDTRTE